MTRILITSLATLLIASPQLAFAAGPANAPRTDRWPAYEALSGNAAPPRRFDNAPVLHGHDDGSHDTATGGPSGGIF